MNYSEMNTPEKSAAIELYYLECLEQKKKLPKNRKIDMVSIASSIAPFKTANLPDDIKRAVENRVRLFLEIK